MQGSITVDVLYEWNHETHSIFYSPASSLTEDGGKVVAIRDHVQNGLDLRENV